MMVEKFAEFYLVHKLGIQLKCIISAHKYRNLHMKLKEQEDLNIFLKNQLFRHWQFMNEN